MKANLDCIPCFQRQALQAARFATDDPEVHEKVLRRVVSRLNSIDWESTPPDIAHEVHGIVREETGENDPYKSVKKKYNDIALEMAPEMEALVSNSKDPLETALRLAIAGNIVDFGAMSEFDLKQTVSEVLEKDFRFFDIKPFRERLSKSEKITYLPDNTGEIVFDRILLETIIKEYAIKHIDFYVKGAPTINDATREDALYVFMDRIPGLRLLDVGVGIPGSGPERSSLEFVEMLEASDIVISKGQGNYESLSEHDFIFFMLMAKCPVVAEKLDANVGDIILKIGGNRAREGLE